MCADVDVESLLRALSTAVTTEPLDRALILDLIARGADPNTRDEYGDTWFETTIFCHEDLTIPAVELLIAAGADVNAEGEEGSRPLYQACVSARADLVQCLLAHGAEPNFVTYESESPLDYVRFNLWYCQDQAGTAWDHDGYRGRVEPLRRIAEILKAAGAKTLTEMHATRLRDWVILSARDIEQVLTGDGYLSLSEIAALSDWVPRWQNWCAGTFDPGDDGFLAAPPGFDRRRHNADGLALAREFKRRAGMGVRVDFYAIDPDSEEAFARNQDRVTDVGGAETRAPLPSPYSEYLREPGFFVRAKARVSPDCSTVTPVLELHIGTEPGFADWTLHLEELERSCQGDGRYAMFTDTGGDVVDVWVTWSKTQVLWHVPRADPAPVNLTFTSAGYAEAIDDAVKSAHHVVRRAWVAVEKHLHRVP